MIRTRVAALIAALALPLMVAPAAHAAAVSSQSVPTSVAQFKGSVQERLTAYVSTYGDRLSPSERERMTGLIAEVDRDLTGLQRKTQRTAALQRAHAPRHTVRAAAHDASTAFDAGYRKALTNLAQVQPILQPRLSIFEALQAKVDLDAQLAEYAELGRQIHGVEDALRP